MTTYRTEDTRGGNPNNQPLVASIETARIAWVRSLFTDDPALFPTDQQETWWEIWLRAGSKQVLAHAARQLEMDLREHSLSFAEREVLLARTTPRTLGRIIASTDTIAELRLARDTPAPFMEMPGREQLG